MILIDTPKEYFVLNELPTIYVGYLEKHAIIISFLDQKNNIAAKIEVNHLV